MSDELTNGNHRAWSKRNFDTTGRTPVRSDHQSRLNSGVKKKCLACKIDGHPSHTHVTAEPSHSRRNAGLGCQPSRLASWPREARDAGGALTRRGEVNEAFGSLELRYGESSGTNPIWLLAEPSL